MSVFIIIKRHFSKLWGLWRKYTWTIYGWEKKSELKRSRSPQWCGERSAVGQSLGPFSSLSKQLLCPCGIDRQWHCRVGSAAPVSAGNPGVPNRSASHGFSSPSGSRSTPLQNTCGLARCHLHGGGAHMTTEAEPDCVWQCVCIHADEVYDLVFSCGMTAGPHIGELFCHYLHCKVSPFYSSRAEFEFRRNFNSVCAPSIVVFTTQRFLNKDRLRCWTESVMMNWFFELPP